MSLDHSLAQRCRVSALQIAHPALHSFSLKAAMAKHRKKPKTVTKKPTTSNWERLKPQLTKGAKKKAQSTPARGLADALQQQAVKKTVKKPHTIKPDTYVALDCEMVDVGSNGAGERPRGVSVVDEQGKVLYDRHVQVDERVTDFRTKYSGVRAKRPQK